jgi:hypothetical protein
MTNLEDRTEVAKKAYNCKNKQTKLIKTFLIIINFINNLNYWK